MIIRTIVWIFTKWLRWRIDRGYNDFLAACYGVPKQTRDESDAEFMKRVRAHVMENVN